MTFVYTDPLFGQHDPGQGHAEQMARHAAILRGLDTLRSVQTQACPEADWETIALAHPEAYCEAIRTADSQTADGKTVSLDADTFMMAASLPAALRAVGGACAGVDALMSGQTRHAYIAARPPGHHAEPSRAMGFCLFATVSIAARYAQQKYGLKKVAILDPDVHHGNGTQAVFWSDPSIFFVSSHQMPLYPGSGAASETGEEGNILNIPFEAGADGEAFKPAWEEAFERVRAFGPELLIISAGYDAHKDDPLGGMSLTTDDFAWFGTQVRALADELCGGKLLSSQEGGYNLDALQASVAAYAAAAA